VTRARATDSLTRRTGEASLDSALEASCYREGEYWTFDFRGRICRLREARGFHCLAQLLRHPGEKFAATSLLQLRPPESDRPMTAESARVLVTKHIRGVVKRIEAHHPSLAHHLGTCVKTGALCVYQSDPERPMRWQVRV
jgi:hypothetical protein